MEAPAAIETAKDVSRLGHLLLGVALAFPLATFPAEYLYAASVRSGAGGRDAAR